MSEPGKIVITNQEVSNVRETPIRNRLEAELPPAIPLLSRILLAPLVLLTPVLCLFLLSVKVVKRKAPARVRDAWNAYATILLIISGLFTSLFCALLLFLFEAPN